MSPARSCSRDTIASATTVGGSEGRFTIDEVLPISVRSFVEIRRRAYSRWTCGSLLLAAIALIAASCSSRKCFPDCVPEIQPGAERLHLPPHSGRGRLRLGLGSNGDWRRRGHARQLRPRGDDLRRRFDVHRKGAPRLPEAFDCAVPGICSVPGRDTCGCGAVSDPCDTPGTVCLMPACCDYPGICVTPAERASICARPEGAHFDCSSVDAGGDRSIDDGPATGHRGAACDPETLAAAIRTAGMQAGTPTSCASPLPPSDAADADGARNATRAFLAATLAVPPDAFMVTALPCGGEVGATCASHFNHDLYKSNGTLADALLPSAKNIESCAMYVEETIWTAVVNGISGPAEVCISGVTRRGS